MSVSKEFVTRVGIMNRAEKAKEYLHRRLADLKDFKGLWQAKPAFFDSIIHFKNTVIPDLRKFKIFEADDIEKLKEVLEAIEPHKSEGGPSRKVHEIGVWPDYGAAQAQIYKLISIATTVKVPLRLRLLDFLSSNALIIAVIAVFLSFTLNVVCR